MPLYEDLGNGVYHIDAQYTADGIACFYCMVEGDEVAIIETGTAYSVPTLLKLLEELSIHPQQVKYVIPTHVHLDHAGGAGVMMQTFPNAELVVHPSGAKHMIDPTALIEATIAVYGEQAFSDLYGEIPAIAADRVISAAHESSFKLQQRELLIVHTPGHAYHHFCVVDPLSNGIFTGDTFGLSYPNLLYQNQRFLLPTTTPTQVDHAALHGSIDLLMSFAPDQMYLTHFNKLSDPSSMVDQLRLWVDKLVDLTLQVKPIDDSSTEVLIEKMGAMIGAGFDLKPDIINGQLANDIKLNSQGLAYWYRKQ